MIFVLIAKLADAIKPSLEGGDMKGDISIHALGPILGSQPYTESPNVQGKDLPKGFNPAGPNFPTNLT